MTSSRASTADPRTAATQPDQPVSSESAKNRIALEEGRVFPARQNSEPAPGAVANGGETRVLLSSLQRLCESHNGQLPVPRPMTGKTEPFNDDAEYGLSASLLEAMFEISDFDPLPQLNRLEENLVTGDFGLGPRADRDLPETSSNQKIFHHHARRAVTAPERSAPATDSGFDRRKLPRRESECLVSVFRCSGDERLTADRIAWLLHSTHLKGTLVDVSMSGISFCLAEPLPAESRILLRIRNRTIDEHVDTAATVLRSRKSGDGDWSIVCRFQRNLTFEQIHVVGRSLFAATIV